MTKRPDEILDEAAKTFRERNALYGNNYKRFGEVMVALFGTDALLFGPAPEDLAEYWARMGVFVQIVSKMTRYAENFATGGHVDSAHDIVVYAAMLEEMTREGKEKAEAPERCGAAAEVRPSTDNRGA